MTQIVPQRQVIYTRAAQFDGLPAEGWEACSTLRCDKITLRAGRRPGQATFTYIPDPFWAKPGGDHQAMAFETAFAAHDLDKQVRVDVYPDGAEPSSAFTAFEGVLHRKQAVLNGGEQGDDETVQFAAEAFPVLDDQARQHRITGQWMWESNGTPWVSDSPDTPAVFNLNGRPNCQEPVPTMLCDGPAEGGAGVTVYAFARNGEYGADVGGGGGYWTVARALLSIIGRWLWGIKSPSGTPLSRFIDVEPATLAELIVVANGGAPQADSWVGLDARLPETDVTGMGVLQAIETVCAAGGFNFALLPRIMQSVASTGRPYQLRIWRRNYGVDDRYVDLVKRGTYQTASSSQLLADNNLIQGRAMLDAGGVRNEITYVGRALFEATFPLLPLWSPGEVEPTIGVTGLESATDEQLAATSGYWAKHVAGGSLYDDYGHVGRVWGIDCTGEWYSAGYTSGAYQHAAGGFDFVTHLNLNATNQWTPLTELYTLGRPPNTPIYWQRRPRAALPLRQFGALTLNRQYLLEVSEDGGSTWQHCPVGITTIRNGFGIRLNVPNLAAMNNASIGTEAKPADVTLSWWGLMRTTDLRFRVTCVVEADHAPSYTAVRQANSGSAYSRSRHMVTEVEDYWIAPLSPRNPESGWMIDPYIGPGLKLIVQAAYRDRDALQNRRFSVAGAVLPMQLTYYQLGCRIVDIRGRDVSLGVNAGDGVAYPDLVAVTVTLFPDEQQIMTLELDDQGMTRGGLG